MMGRNRWRHVFALLGALVLLGSADPATGQLRFPSRPTQQRTDRTSARSDHARHMLDDAELRGVHFVDAQHGWAVGDRGAIWHTPDGGDTWRLQRSGVDCRLEAVHFLDRRTGWAVGGSIRPYSHRGEGVVLRTLDGGRRWTRIPDLTLPQLKRVEFFSPTRGWAVGAPSALYGGGVFQTIDGGRSWRPVDAASEHWLCADFRDPNSGAIAGERGKLSVVMTQGAVKSRTPDLGMRAIRDLQLAGDTGGWLVGDGGLVMTTTDGGLTWQLPPRAIPGAARHEIDFAAAAAHGDHVWAVGSPGSLVLHSPDAGRTWELQRTGQPLPLHAIHFADATHGWAVGALGTILATRDGGQSWHRARSGGTRASVLFILADEKELPLELVARLGGDEGYLCAAEIIGRRDIDAPQPLAASAEDRIAAALVAAGGSAAMQSWQFPLRDQRLTLSEDRILRHWNVAHDGQAMPLLQAHLVRAIRTWRPDVIITHGESTSSLAQRNLVGRLVREAAQRAGDSTILPQQLTHAHLRPWQTKKVFTICSADEAGDVSVSAASLALRLGKSLADYCAQPRGLLHEELSPAPTLTEFRLAQHHVAQELDRRDFLSGITSHPGGEARRKLGEVPPGDIDALRRLAQKRRNVEQLIAQTETIAVDDDAWLGQVNELTRGLDDAAAARLVYQLGWRYANSGRADLGAEVFHILAERYRDQPVSEQALAWLIRHYTSAEAAWRRRDRASPAAQLARVNVPIDRPPASDDAPSRLVPASFDQPDDGAPLQSEAQPARPQRQWGRALALHKLLQQTDPTMAAEPALQLAIAAAQRQSGAPRQAEALYRQIAGANLSTAWGACAQAELWLRDPRSECPKPLARCGRAEEKPFLDGKLDEALWQAAEPLRLRSRYADDRPWPAVIKLARDDDYLYLAAQCRKAPDAEYPPAEQPRTRDAADDGRDRVELLLDVNRDWNSAFRLTIDHRGAASDAVDTDGSWSPTYHVSASGDEDTWTIEAAIPLAELGSQTPAPRDVWALGVRRIVPGVGRQSWTPTDGAGDDLSGLGLLLFE